MKKSAAPINVIKTVNYIVLGPTPMPAHADLVNIVRARMPGAKIGYRINEQVQKIIDSVCAKPYQDSFAQKEWGWKHEYGLTEIVDSFLKQDRANNMMPKK